MSAEIFDVEINIDGVIILYGTKVSAKKQKDTKTTLTFNGDVSTGAKNTGGTISFEGLYWPSDVKQSIELENKLNSDNIKVVTCTGSSYTANGDAYRKTIIGSGVTITSDEEDWSPSDGITHKLEMAVNTLTRKAESN